MPDRPDDRSQDDRSPKDILKAQRMLVIIFAVATLMPTLWMLLMAYGGITAGQGTTTPFDGFSTVLIYWGYAAPVVWLTANGFALQRIQAGKGDSARYFPLIPAFWAIFWFASQVTV